jgi:hypothetical protein
VTGPEHHRKAERLVGAAREAGKKFIPTPTRVTFGGGGGLPDFPDYGKFYTNEDSDPRCRNLLADAQVHATLALAAATEAARSRPANADGPSSPDPEDDSPMFADQDDDFRLRGGGPGVPSRRGSTRQRPTQGRTGWT